MSNTNVRLRVNEQIRISPVRVIDQDKNMLGIIPTEEALRLAREAGLDLVEMSPQERPPVCRIMDYGKHKYQLSKKQKQKHHEQKIKEVRMRPKTDEHDKEIKVKHAREFLEHGDRVQFTMLFRGRERFHQEISLQSFRDIAKELEDIAKIDAPPRFMGRRMTMVLAPQKLPGTKPKPQAQPGAAKEKKPRPQPAAEARPAAGPVPDRPQTAEA